VVAPRSSSAGRVAKIKGFAKKGFVSEVAFFHGVSTFAEAVRTVGTSVSALDDRTRWYRDLVGARGGEDHGLVQPRRRTWPSQKVLLIDADLKRPKIGRLVGRDPKSGTR
jgi:hypothetical protein